MSEREGFLSRWSRRKREAASGHVPAEAPPPAAVREENAALAAMTKPAPASAAADASIATPAAPAALPPVESLTLESDFAPFMAKEVDPGLQRAALKKLFQDERFNIMDGLDVYIDDYTKPNPIPESWYGKMAQMARLGDFNAAPPEVREAEEAAAPPRASDDAPDAAAASAAPADGSRDPARDPDSGTLPSSPPAAPE
jgi:hypothetical protein